MKKVAALLALALAAAALVACGDDGATAGGEEGEVAILRLATPPGKELAYTTTKASTEAGEVAVEFDNPQPVRHNVTFEDSSGKTIGTTGKSIERVTSTIIDFKPGKYTFFCHLDGHREAGMEGTLTVE